MAKGMILRRGGAGLNFEIRAYASELLLPAVTRENTIAVITEEPINRWVFSSAPPENPAQGDVWFRMAQSSPATFNALKSNGILVRLAWCRQYVDGAWTPTEARLYSGGAWVNGFSELYVDGAEITTFTGRWTKNADHLYARVVGLNPVNQYTDEKIDLAGYNTLKVRYEGSAANTPNTSGRFGIMATKPGPTAALASGSFVASVIAERNLGVTIASLDISACNDSYYVVLHSGRMDGSNVITHSVYKIWME